MSDKLDKLDKVADSLRRVADGVDGLERRVARADAPSEKHNGKDENVLRRVGKSLVKKFNTSRAVREWARSEEYNRAQEAYIIEGFKYARKLEGLSENV